MLTELYDRIQETAQPQTFEVAGTTYLVTQDGVLSEVFPKSIIPDTLLLNSLDALVQLVKTEFAYRTNHDKNSLYITIPDHLTVRCFGHPDYSKRAVRPVYYKAHATDVPGFQGGFREQQQAIIELRSKFIPNDGTEYLLDLLSRIDKESNVVSSDNGISQTVEARQGVSLKSIVSVKPRVPLRPYRTFQEVEQPESEFLLRLNNEGEVGLFEADGGMWKLRARETIKAFLEDKLAREISDGAVVVAL